MSSPAPLAALIRGRRVSARLTQEELAERAGISVRTISDI
jgi:transcriptional regulator with XRE-family HTH domain